MIRLAALKDLDRIVELGRNFHAASKYRDLIGEDNDAMEELAYNLITGSDGAIFVTTSDQQGLDSPVVGMLGLTTFRHPISGQTFASELFWWVEPDFRGRGIRLLYAAERWARSRGARALQMIAPTPDVAAMYSRLGYDEIESTYQKALVAAEGE